MSQKITVQNELAHLHMENLTMILATLDWKIMHHPPCPLKFYQWGKHVLAVPGKCVSMAQLPKHLLQNGKLFQTVWRLFYTEMKETGYMYTS
jgi:hypothetical protein